MLAGGSSSGGQGSPAWPALHPSALQQLQETQQRAQAAERRAQAAERNVQLLHRQMDEQQTLLEREVSRAAEAEGRSLRLHAEVERLRAAAAGGSAAADLRQRLSEAEQEMNRLRQALKAESSTLSATIAAQAGLREELASERSALCKAVAAEASLREELAAERAAAVQAAQDAERQLAAMARLLAELQEAAAVGEGVHEAATRLAGMALGAAHAASGSLSGSGTGSGSGSLNGSGAGHGSSRLPPPPPQPPASPANVSSAAEPPSTPASAPTLPPRLPGSDGAVRFACVEAGCPTSALWLGNILLQPRPSAEQLLQFFSPFGSLHSVRVGKTPAYGTLGYAFVNFVTEGSALAAMNACQGMALPWLTGQLQLRIQYRPPGVQPHQLLSSLPMASQQVPAGQQGSGSSASGSAASPQLDLQRRHSAPPGVVSEQAVPPAERLPGPPPPWEGHDTPSRHIWLGNLTCVEDGGPTKAQLADRLAAYGPIERVAASSVPRQRYAFVTFHSLDAAQRAAQELADCVVPALSGSDHLLIRYKHLGL